MTSCYCLTDETSAERKHACVHIYSNHALCWTPLINFKIYVKQICDRLLQSKFVIRLVRHVAGKYLNNHKHAHTLLTIADTDRGRPTLKVKDERFRNRLSRDLNCSRTLMCTRLNLCCCRTLMCTRSNSMLTCFIEIKLFKCATELY